MPTATRSRAESKASVAPAPIPPHNLDAEMAVLGSIMLDPACLEHVVEFLRPEDFYRSTNGLIFEAALKLYAKGEPIDNVTLAQELTAMEVLERVGGRTQLASLQMAVPTAANAAYYGKMVKERALRRELASASTEIGRLAHDDAHDVEAALQQAQQMLFCLAEGDTHEIVRLEEVLHQVLRDYEERKPGQLSGLATGFTDIDHKLNGLRKGEVYIIAARPGMGKTSWLLQVACNVAKAGTPVAVFSLEMSNDQLATRLLAQEARVDALRFERHELSPTEYDKVMRAAGPLAEARIELDDTSPMDELKLLHRARQLVRSKGVGLIVLDYVQLLAAHYSQPNNRVAEMTAISRALKVMATQLRVPVLAASQLNRAPEARMGDHRPKLSDLRESGAFEQDATAVGFLYRPEYYKAEDKPGVCEVIFEKNRFGPTGTVELTFRKELTRFESIAREPAR